MTVERLQAIAEKALAFAIKSIRETGELKYKRVDNGRAVELVGAPHVLTTVPDERGLSGKFSGRFMNFFAGMRQSEGRA